MSLPRTGVALLAFLVIAGVLGAFMGGAADMVLGDAIVGTPLGPSSDLAPLVWTGIAGAVIYGVNEVRG